MSAFQRGKNGNASIYVPTRSGRPVQRSTGSSVPVVVRGMKRMVVRLKDEHRWLILDAIEAKRLKLSDAYTYHVANRLEELEARLSSVNLSDHLSAWIQWVRANRHADVRTADVYWQQVTTLIPERGEFLGSDLTKARVLAWLTGRDKTTSGTKRKYFYALRSFIRYLMDAGILKADPVAGLKAPKKDRARTRWETAAVDETITANADEEFRALFAFVKGTGCDLGAALRAQKGDVNLFAGKVDIRGTKTDRRAVHQASIEAWALPYIREHVKKMGNADRHELLFPTLNRNRPSKHHKKVCATLRVVGYTLKDARHSVAVRMRKNGREFEDIAAQLGTSVLQVVNVYSVFKPEVEADAQAEAK